LLAVHRSLSPCGNRPIAAYAVLGNDNFSSISMNLQKVRFIEICHSRESGNPEINAITVW
jgi:hypothetical protein